MNDADEQQLAERVVARMMAHDAFSQWLGIEIVDVKPRASRIRMTVRDEMLNGFGTCHGGVTFAFADSALGFATNTHGRITVAVENSITYPTKVSSGDVLEAAACEEGATNRLGFYRVTVTRGEDTVALFRGTVYKTNQSLFPGSE